MPLRAGEDAIGAALGRIPSGCGILAVRHQREATGVLVSWFQQASFDPPVISVAVKKGRYVEKLLEESHQFVLNLIGEDPTALFKHFGKGFEPDEDAFVGLNPQETPFGPMLPSAIAGLGCEVADTMEAGDHRLYLGRVKAALGDAGKQPYVHLRRSGLSY